MDFDGETYDEQRDGPRLTGQLKRVYEIVADGRWYTLHGIRNRGADASEASISARLRDLRKPRFGAYRIERSYIANGEWAYRLLPPTPRVVRADPALLLDPEAVSMVPIPGWRAGDA